MGEDVIFVALGRGRLPGIFEIAASRPFVVFGTMDGKALAGFDTRSEGGMVSSSHAYFYETG